MGEEGQTEVSKEPLEVSIVTETRAVTKDLDPGEFSDLVECTQLCPFSEKKQTTKLIVLAMQ